MGTSEAFNEVAGGMSPANNRTLLTRTATQRLLLDSLAEIAVSGAHRLDDHAA